MQSFNVVEPDLFKKYIAYSRQNCHPSLTPDAASILEKAYVNTRIKTSNNTVPITVRNLFSMTRIAYAHARMRLSPAVTAEDAQAAVDLVLKTLSKVGIDPETGGLDSLVMEMGKSKTAFDRTKAIRDIIKGLSATMGYAHVDAVKEEAVRRGISEDRSDDIMDRMRQSGELTYPAWDRVRLV